MGETLSQLTECDLPVGISDSRNESLPDLGSSATAASCPGPGLFSFSL